MADFTNLVLVASSSGIQTIGAANRVVLTNFKVSGAVDFTGATLTGVTTSGISDATASLGLDGSGNLTETSLVTANITPSGALTLRGGGVSQFGDDTGYFNWDGAGALSTSGATTVDLDASGAIQINSTGAAISIGNDANNFAGNLFTGGTRAVALGGAGTTLTLNSTAGASVFTVKDNDAAAFKIQGSDSTARVTVNTVNADEGLELNCKLLLTSSAGAGGIAQFATAGAALSTGDVVAVSGTAGKVFGAEADSATAVLQNPVGVALNSPAGDSQPVVYAIGGIVSVTFDASVATSDHGKLVYLSETAKRATLTAPGTSGSSVWLLGVLVGAAGTTTGQILFRPQFLHVIGA